jgi:hypothetical protein
MLKFGILMPLLGAAALASIGCDSVNVVKVNAAGVDVACKRVYFTSTIKQGDGYADGVPTLVATAPDAGVIPIGATPQIDVTKPVLISLKVERTDQGCARFPKGSAWRFDGVLPQAVKNAAGESVHAIDFDRFAPAQ